MPAPRFDTSLIVATLLFLLPCAGFAGDELDQLRREVELLKQENALLKQEVAQLKARLAESTTAPPATDNDEIVGKIWEISLLGPQDRVVATARFLASDGILYNRKERIGHFTQNGTRVRMDITHAPDARANGVYTLVQFEKNPIGYRGTARNTKGAEGRVILRLITD